MSAVELTLETFFPHVSKSQLWERASDWKAINHEFAPLFRLTSPGVPMTELRTELLPKTIYIFLFGFLPIDAHTVLKFNIVNGNDEGEFMFEEESRSTMIKVWKHRRTLLEENGGVTLQDNIQITPKLSCLSFAMKAIYSKIFRRRQKRLLAYFQRLQPTPSVTST